MDFGGVSTDELTMARELLGRLQTLDTVWPLQTQVNKMVAVAGDDDVGTRGLAVVALLVASYPGLSLEQLRHAIADALWTRMHESS